MSHISPVTVSLILALILSAPCGCECPRPASEPLTNEVLLDQASVPPRPAPVPPEPPEPRSTLAIETTPAVVALDVEVQFRAYADPQ